MLPYQLKEIYTPGVVGIMVDWAMVRQYRMFPLVEKYLDISFELKSVKLD